MHQVFCITHHKYFHMVYGSILMFIFSCSQSSARYRARPIMGSTTQSSPNKHVKCKEKENNSEDHLLHKAAYTNDYKRVKAIVTLYKLKDKDTSHMRMHQKDNQGYLPIHWAMGEKSSYKTKREAKANLKIIKLLLKYPNSNQGDDNQLTALHWAVCNKHLKAVKVLLEYFIKKLPHTEFLNFINHKDIKGFTALHYAVDRDKKGIYTQTSLQILTTLLDFAGVNFQATDKNGRTFLHWAVINNNLVAVKAILTHAQSALTSQAYKEFIQMKTFISETTSEGGCTAIFWTVNPEYPGQDNQPADARRFEIFNLLWPECKINDTDNQEHTIAHWVVVRGDPKMLKVLIEQQADLSIQDKKGRTVLHTAIEALASAYTDNNRGLIESFTGAGNILDQLLSLTSSKIGCNKKDNSGYTPAEQARNHKLPDPIIKRLEEKEKEEKPCKRPNSDASTEESHLPPKKRVSYRRD